MTRFSLSQSTFILIYLYTLDDSGPEEGQSSSGDEELEPEADQLSSRGELFCVKIRLCMASLEWLFN